MAPKKKRNEMKHSNIICLRLSDIELELVNHAASQAKLSRSDYLRNLILDHKMAIHYEVVIESKTVKMLLAEYGKSALILIRLQSILTLEERTLNL